MIHQPRASPRFIREHEAFLRVFNTRPTVPKRNYHVKTGKAMPSFSQNPQAVTTPETDGSQPSRLPACVGMHHVVLPRTSVPENRVLSTAYVSTQDAFIMHSQFLFH